MLVSLKGVERVGGVGTGRIDSSCILGRPRMAAGRTRRVVQAHQLRGLKSGTIANCTTSTNIGCHSCSVDDGCAGENRFWSPQLPTCGIRRHIPDHCRGSWTPYAGHLSSPFQLIPCLHRSVSQPLGSKSPQSYEKFYNLR